MDANNTKYHLIYGERDWLPLLIEQSSVDMWWDSEKQSVSLAPIVQQLDDFSQSQLLNEDLRRGAAYDHYGNIYWINDAENEIVYHPAATPLESGSFWQVDLLEALCPSPVDSQHGDFKSASDTSSLGAIPQTVKPKLKGLTVTSHEYLVVGTVEPAGLLVFDCHAGGPPTWLCWPKQIEFSPFDISCAPDGGLWVLDRDFVSGESRVWHLDKNFRVLDCSGESVDLLSVFSHDFFTSPEEMSNLDDGSEGESDGVARRRFLSGLSINVGGSVLAEVPVAIEALSANRFILLNTSLSDESSVIHYFVDGALVDSVSLDESVIGGLLGEPAIFAHDFAFVPDSNDDDRSVVGSLYVAVTHAKQSYKFSLRASETALTLVLQPILLPMRAYSGKGLIASGAKAFYDFGDRWLPLAEQPRQTFQSEAVINGIIKDGEEPDCVWHRIIIDACIPAGTSVVFESRCSNTEETLSEAAWQLEPQVHLRADGAELPFYDPYDLEKVNADITGSWDVLFQNAVGRFVELRLRLTGNKRSTPRIQSCRIYYPRFSYVDRYLPAVYQDDQSSASFLDRFLANVEGLYTGLEDKIARAESLFDTRTSPSEFLDWLGGWLGAFIDPSWDDNRKRLFIDNAILLFNWRGTVMGLQALLTLSTAPCPDERLFDALRSKSEQGISESGQELDTKEPAFSGGIRIVEHYQTRRNSGILLNDSNPIDSETSLEQEGNRSSWEPAFGAGILHEKYQDFLAATYANNIAHLNLAWETSLTTFGDILFPPTLPKSLRFDNDSEQRDWLHFTRDFIGFTYPQVTDDDEWRFQDYCQRRYRQIEKFNAAHGLLGDFERSSFDDIALPKDFPNNKQALSDWIEFVSLALPIAQQAHTFTVLLPTVLGDLPSELELQRARVEEIVAREKPAHTLFDVKYFWAMFQVGSARLGIDTNIGDGGRFVALVLGENFLGQSFLSESHPWSVVDRSIVGRGRLRSSLEWRV